MPVVVHITAAKNERSILRSGIKPGASGVVYFMPVVQSHLVSHQWLRELKRFSSSRELVGVYARLPAEEMVWSGRYNDTHRQGRLGEAIGELNRLADPLGFEMFVERKIEAREVERVRALPQLLGWRYQPHAHGKRPCGCPACLAKGGYGTGQLRLRLEGPKPKMPSLATTLAKLAQAQNAHDVQDCLWTLRTKRRAMDPAALRPLMKSGDEEILEELAITLPYFRHPSTAAMLQELIAGTNARIAELASEALEAYKAGRTSARDAG